MRQPSNEGRKSPVTARNTPVTSRTSTRKTVVKSAAAPGDFPLTMQNYKLMLLGFGIIILGFFLMAGTTDIYDFRKTTLATIVVLAGFIFEIYAIMKRPKVNNEEVRD